MEIGGQFIVTGGNGPVILQAAEYTLNGIVTFVEGLGKVAFRASVGFGGDDWAVVVQPPKLCVTQSEPVQSHVPPVAEHEARFRQKGSPLLWVPILVG